MLPPNRASEGVVVPADAHTRVGGEGAGAAVVAAVLLVVALSAAISVDVVKTGFGIKGDEATYVAMALSAAYDHDLSYQRQDLARFTGLYRSGPEGIFLKRGKRLRIELGGSAPYVHLAKRPDPRTDRLYFGKPFIYSVAAAPFVWLRGLNGLLVFHVLLLFTVCVCGYTFLAARSRRGAALLFTLAFVGASVIPVYAVFLTPEIFNFALVFVAYFLWLYKEVAPPEGVRFLRGRGSDLLAAVLLGLATYSKPTNALLIAPMVLLWWMRRGYWRGFVAGAVFVAAAAGMFGLNALSSGEFNYQGGDRKTFYSAFPFDAPDATWEQRGIVMTTNDSDAESVLAPSEFASRFAHNVEYFLVGRHFGLVPYFFPGVVCVGLWLFSRERMVAWRLLTFLALAASVVALLVFLPYSWSGGGGPPGDRYFVSLYPALFFLTPPLSSISPGMLAWIGGALFTAKMLVNPFVAAKYTYLTPEYGAVRRLPVEVTMANDLPIMLDAPRAHVWYADVLLYFLDKHAYVPETVDGAGTRGIWIAGDGRADILMRSDWPIDHLAMTLRSPIRTTVIVSAGGTELELPIVPGTPVTVDVPASGVRGFQSYAYLLSAQSTEAFTPHLQNPASRDYRNLGVMMTFTAVPAK